MTALMFLCLYDENITPNLIQELKDEIGMKDDSGTTALMYLCEIYKYINPELIIELKKEIRMKDKNKKTAYDCYCKERCMKDEKILKLLNVF